MRRILTSATLTVALALPLAACGDDPAPAPTPSASTTPATASPSPTGPVAPEIPAAAKANSAAGAKAFVPYVFEVITYATTSGDTAPLKSISAEECAACKGLHEQIDRVYGSGAHFEGGGWHLEEQGPDPSVAMPYQRYLVVISQPRQSLISSAGETISRRKAKRFPMRLTVVWRDSQWLMQEGIDES